MPGPSEDFQNRLWQQLNTQRNQSHTRTHKPVIRRHPAWVVIVALLIVFIALFIGFGPKNVYAFFRQILGIGDAGIQSVQESGLVTDLEMTADPTLIPDESTPVTPPLNATAVNLSETHEGITLTLDWAYIDEGRLALSWTTSPLPEDLTYGTPELDFKGYTPPQEQGAVQILRDENDQLIFVSYQVIQVDAAGEVFDFSVDLPLIREDGQAGESPALFHFDLEDIPIFRGRTISLQQTYAHQINSVELRLESVQVAPATTTLVVCYDDPADEGPLWTMQNATLQMGNGTEEGSLSSQELSEYTDDHCVRFNFGSGSETETGQIIFRVHGLVDDSSGEEMTGPWQFYVDLPTTDDFNNEEPETPEATEVGSQTQSDVTVTLDWVFVDALRAAVGYTVTGLPDVPEAAGLQGNIHLYDAQGNEVGGMGIGTSDVIRSEDQPGVVQGTWSVGFTSPLEQTEASFQLAITLEGSSQPGSEYIAGFPVAPEATPYPPNEFPPSLPDHFIGTYIFDFTTSVQPLTVLTDIPSVTVNGIEVFVPRMEVTASMSKVMICYQKPSERDWWIFDATVSNGIDESRMSGGQLIYDPDVEVYQGYNTEDWPVPADFQTVEHGRCLLLNFLQGQDDPSGTLTLTIPGLEISPPEVIPDAELAAALEILEAQGIEMSYEVSRGSGGGGGGFIYNKLPEGMTESEAYQKYLEALGYIFAGPWEIPLIIQP